MKASEKVKATIFRFTSDVDKEARFDFFEIPYEEGMTVLDCLLHIQENLDPTLVFRYSCKHEATCGICTVKVNGRAGLSCKTLAQKEMKIEPFTMPVIRDLVTQRL